MGSVIKASGYWGMNPKIWTSFCNRQKIKCKLIRIILSFLLFVWGMYQGASVFSAITPSVCCSACLQNKCGQSIALLHCSELQFLFSKSVAEQREKERSTPPSQLSEWLQFVLVMGTRCQSIKGSWTQQKDCHFDLPLNSSFFLFSFFPPPLTKSGTHKHAEWSGKKQLDSGERSHKQKWDGRLPLFLSGWHLPVFVEMPFMEGGGRINKKINLSRAVFPLPLWLLLSPQKDFYFVFSPSFRGDDGCFLGTLFSLPSAMVWKLTQFLFLYTEHLVYYIYHSICPCKTGLHL